MRPHAAISLCALPLLLVSCGAERAEPPPSEARPGEETNRVKYRQAGVAASVPRSAATESRRAPGVFRTALGRSVVAVFAYRRREQLPRNSRELQTARRRLVAEARRRGRGDRRLRLIRSRVTKVNGARAIELLADQSISRARLRTRSLHVFKRRGEYVVEMHAPPRLFRIASRNFFVPLVRSLELSGRVRPSRRRRR